MKSVLVALFALVGLIMGFIGGGGAVIAVPLFRIVYDLPPYQAIEVSLVLVFLASVMTLVISALRSRVDYGRAVPFAILGPLGALGGVWLRYRIWDWVLMVAFGAFLVWMAFQTWRSTQRTLPRGLSWMAIILRGIAVGFATGLFGISGGFLMTPIFLVRFHMSLAQAVGTSVLVVCMSNATAIFAAWERSLQTAVQIPKLNWILILCFIGVIVGQVMANRTSNMLARKILSVVMVMVAVIIWAREWISNTTEQSPSFLPANTLEVAEGEFPRDGGGLQNRMIFDDAVARFQKTWSDEVERLTGDELVIWAQWSTNTVNAWADRKSGRREIAVTGGLARMPVMSVDGLMLVLCHELGHHIGGHPKKMGNRWSTGEGQADYFAMTKCLKRMWIHENWQSENPVPDDVRQHCATRYSSGGSHFAQSSRQQQLCERMSIAGFHVARMIQVVQQENEEPNFYFRAPAISHMETSYTTSQCRLDTYFEGALCDKDHRESFGDDDWDLSRGACMQQPYRPYLGARPPCWFRAYAR